MKDEDIKWIQRMTQEITGKAAAARLQRKPNFYQPLVAANFPEQDTREQLQAAISSELKNQGFAASEWAALEPGIFSIFVPFSTEEREQAIKAGYAFAQAEGITPPTN